MSKPTLKQTQRTVLDYFNRLPTDTQYEWATTPLDGQTQQARLRRLLIKATNDVNIKRLRV